jgi:hypothetical protein
MGVCTTLHVVNGNRISVVHHPMRERACSPIRVMSTRKEGAIMALVRINLDTAQDEPDTRLLDRLMREKPVPVVRGQIRTPNGNLIVQVAR